MSFIEAYLHLALLTSLCALVGAALWAWRCREATEQLHRARLAWVTCGAAMGVWLVDIAWVDGLSLHVVLAALVWTSGWVLLARLLRPGSVPMGIGMTALLGLFGAGLALHLDLALHHSRAWDTMQIVFTGTAVAVTASAVWIGRAHEERLTPLWGAAGVKLALFTTVLALVASRLALLDSAVWALATGAFLHGVALVAARVASPNPLVPGNLVQWLHLWRFAGVMAAGPLLVLLLVPGRGADLSPAVALALLLLATMATAGHKRAALVLFGVALCAAYVLFAFSTPERLVERVHAAIRPEEASSQQQLDCLWAVARAGPFGRGVGHYVLRNGSPAAHADTGDALVRPALPLATTDGVWAIAVETLGSVGAFALLVLVLIVAAWLWHEASSAKMVAPRIWLVGVFTLWTALSLFQAAWPVSRLPVMGLAFPILGGGIGNQVLWTVLLGICSAQAAAPGRILPPRQPVFRHTALRPAVPRYLCGVFTVWIATGLLTYGVLCRQETLSTVFTGRHDEAFARAAVMQGYVRKVGGRVAVTAPLPAEVRNPERLRHQLERLLERGALRIDRTGRVAVADSSAFHREEPSGLGRVLRISGRQP